MSKLVTHVQVHQKPICIGASLIPELPAAYSSIIDAAQQASTDEVMIHVYDYEVMI